jgi:hypothetical protein
MLVMLDIEIKGTTDRRGWILSNASFLLFLLDRGLCGGIIPSDVPGGRTILRTTLAGRVDE